MSLHRSIVASRLSIGVALGILIVGASTVFILSRVVPLTGRQTLIIDGRSMEPTVPFGSAVVVTPVPPADLRVGDVVSLRSGPEHAIFTHHIVCLAGDGCSFVLKRASAIFAETAMPTAFATPCPSGPVVVSMPLGSWVSSG